MTESAGQPSSAGPNAKTGLVREAGRKPDEPSPGFVVASHNIMHGVFLEQLVAHYRGLCDELGLSALFLQENELRPEGGSHAEVVCRALAGFSCNYLPEFPRLAVLLDDSLPVVETFLIALPRLAKLSWFEKTYIRGGKTKQKYALAVRTVWREKPLTLVNFHLDTAGDNQHRAAQVQAIASALTEREPHGSLIACGDTNAFVWSRNPGVSQLETLMRPLVESLGVRLLVDGSPTHFFARQREGLLTHRALVALGHLGIDHPLPYDVICSDLPARSIGQITTRESDHDLVYAVL